MVLELDHPLEGKVPPNWHRRSVCPTRRRPFARFAPALGEHSVEVLQSIGYSENEIERARKGRRRPRAESSGVVLQEMAGVRLAQV